MTTIKITARDSSTAMEEVSKKLGADAFILSTTSKEGGVEIEATNDPIELKKYSEKPKKKFSNLIKKELGNVAEFPLPKPTHRSLGSVPDYHEIGSKATESNLSLLTEKIESLTNEIKGMYITGSNGLGVELGESSFIKFEKAGFATSVIKALSPSFSGLNFERGRTAFMNALAKKLTVPDVENKLKRVTFISGLSGVGKSTLTAKMSVSEQENYSGQISLAKLGYKTDTKDDFLRSHSRLLNKPVLWLNPDNLMETLCSIKGKIIIDVSLEPNDGVNSILNAIEFLSASEISSIIAIPGGSSSSFIRGQANLYKDLHSELTLTKLDECDLTSIEMSEFFLNSMKIHYLTGSKLISGGVSICNKEILTQYLLENC
ncbi:MAG: hypothetical protein CML40_09405 [Rhodobacteraceae bacterium]|nr:MAG: hypothetical protein CML40_09405 [Paracoccaceae bacterium]|tara:strand:- start:3680 stop:4804 length:1125 start_codon:yes stop_codon:yes gene_type:complete